MPETELDRLIPLEHAFNLRDLGGYRTEDGRVVRWRTLFRADGLHRLSAADLEALRPLGLHTVIDLRTEAEVEAGRFPVDHLPVVWHHLALLDVIWDIDQAPEVESEVAGFMFVKYREMIETGGEQLAAAVRFLAAPGALPGLFHCAAGKDRTGVLAALVLSTLGVPDEDVVADYALSGAAMERLLTWARELRPELAARIDAQPAAHLTAEPEAMRQLLAWIRNEHGSTAALLEGLGVDAHTQADLADALLEAA